MLWGVATAVEPDQRGESATKRSSSGCAKDGNGRSLAREYHDAVKKFELVGRVAGCVVGLAAGFWCSCRLW